LRSSLLVLYKAIEQYAFQMWSKWIFSRIEKVISVGSKADSTNEEKVLAISLVKRIDGKALTGVISR